MAANTIENSGIHYGSHLRMDAERNYNMEVAKDEMANAIGIKGDPITLYPLLDEHEQDIEIDKATKPPCYLTANQVKGMLCSPRDGKSGGASSGAAGKKKEKKSRKLKEGWDGEEEEEEEDGEDVEVIEPTPAEEDLAKQILLKNPRCQYEYSVILSLLQQQRKAREAFELVEDSARNALADVWCLQWEELFDQSTESMRRAVEMKRDRLARDYRFERLAQRRAEVEQQIAKKVEEVFHTEEMLKELDGFRGVEFWQQQLASYFYNNPLYLEYEEKLQIEDKTQA